MSPERSRLIFAGNQPTFLPWLGLFEQMAVADVFVICDSFQSSFPGWLNRNKIKGPKGVVWLRIPVKHQPEGLINEVELDETQNWRKKHLKTIESNYRKAAHFDAIWPSVQELYRLETGRLADFTITMTKRFSEILGLAVDFRLSSELPLVGRKNEQAIDLIEKVGCNAAYVAAGTTAYIIDDRFTDHGIEVIYQEYAHPVYPQLWGEFISHLGLLDLLMNCGPDSLRVLLSTRALGDKGARVRPV